MEEGGLELMVGVGEVGVFVGEDDVGVLHFDEAEVETYFANGFDGVGVLGEKSDVGVGFDFGGEDDLYLDLCLLEE
jgi:hypothetical protein